MISLLSLQRSRKFTLALAAALLLCVACTGGCAQLASPVSASTDTHITISPSSGLLSTNGTLQLQVSVHGAVDDKAVTWRASIGTISSTGLYTAPPIPGTATVSATSVADASKSATATVTIVSAASSGVTDVTISPTSASSPEGGTAQFTGAVQGSAADKSVSWKATSGVVTSSGLYTAPSNLGTVTITVTSNADPSKTATATVTVTARPNAGGVSSVILSPASASSVTSGTLPFKATVQGSTSNKTVSWKAALGTVSSSGNYTAPANAGTDKVTATSNADPSKTATATVTVTAGPNAVSSVSISPASASSVTRGTLPFKATVQGTTSNKTVSWKAALGIISSSGNYIAPANAATDKVTATSNADPTKFASAVVAVSGMPAPLPIIASLTATPATVQLGQSVSIQWSVTGASTVQLSGVPAVSGNIAKVTPSKTTTYTLTATNTSGSVSQNVTVEVLAAQQLVEIGVVTHFGQNKGNVQANLDLIQQMGATSIRDEIDWAKVERQPGQYAISTSTDNFVNASLAKGQKPLVTLCYGNPFYDNGDKPISPTAIEGFARYAEFVVRHFKGTVSRYEIWNEWDNGVGHTTPGTAATYVNLLKVVYPRLKAIDPNLVILGGAMSGGAVRGPWLGEMLAAGALSSADAISIHQYIFHSTGYRKTPEALVDHINAAENTVRSYNGGKDFPLYLTETGWPTTVLGTPPDEVADFDAQTVLLAPTMPFLKGIWWYDFQDNGTDPSNVEDNFGLVRADLSPKPGYFALSAVTRWVNGAKFSGRITASDPAVDGSKFVLPNGEQGMAIWKQGTGSSQVKIKGARATQSLYSGLPGATSDPLILNLTEAPVWVTGTTLELQ
jgi:polysaccharide biosynthesis protein PslG